MKSSWVSPLVCPVGPGAGPRPGIGTAAALWPPKSPLVAATQTGTDCLWGLGKPDSPGAPVAWGSEGHREGLVQGNKLPVRSSRVLGLPDCQVLTAGGTGLCARRWPESRPETVATAVELGSSGRRWSRGSH